MIRIAQAFGILVLLCSISFTQTAVPADTSQKPAQAANPGSLAASAPGSGESAKPNLYPIEKIPVSDSIKVPVLDFKNTDIRDVLRALGMQYNVNIFLEPDVKGPVSLYLVNVTVRNAIDFIVKRSNFAYTVENGIVKVYRYQEPVLAPSKPAMLFHVQDGLLDVDIKDLPAQEVGRLFADSASLNVAVEGGADKFITARLTRLKADKAVKVIFEGNGFEVSNSDGVFYASTQWSKEQSGATQNAGGLKRLSITVGKDHRVTMEVDNASLDQCVRTIAVQCGINVIIYDQIVGTITAKFDSLPVDDVLRYLLQNTKFTFWKDRDIYFIGSREMSQQKTAAVIPLRHIMADEGEIAKMLPPHITSSAVLKFDKEHNAIIVIGSFDVIAQAQEYIEKLDKPIPQVLIEALVVDFNVNKIREFGMSIFTQSSRDSTGNWNSEQFLPNLDLKPGRNNTLRALKEVLNLLGINRVIDLPSNFRSTIQALETADVVKVHSTPQIATINGNPASITIGETRYYKLHKETRAASLTSDNTIGTDERFEKIDLNTKLEVTPWVMDQGYVMVKIHPEFQIPRTGGEADRPPSTDNRVLESMVRLRDGQTIILGGQRQTSDVVNRKGIPFLSSIPILGFIFSSRTVSTTETQMMIFLTPHVYYGDEGQVKPEDFFGKDVEKLLDKNNPSRVKTRREQTMKAKQNQVAADSTGIRNVGEKDKKKWSFPWPWKKK
jgi:type II secretory pathway component GspD/PulD (secretin)